MPRGKRSGVLARLRRLIVDRRGQDLVEYALLVGFLALAASATFPDISHNLNHIHEHVSKSLKKEGPRP